jgi:hypothetical protein
MIKPHRRTIEAFKSWMEGEADGRGVPVITGLSANRLVDASDLIALHPPVDQDWLTRFVRRYFRILFVVILLLLLPHTLHGQLFMSHNPSCSLEQI